MPWKFEKDCHHDIKEVHKQRKFVQNHISSKLRKEKYAHEHTYVWYDTELRFEKKRDELLSDRDFEGTVIENSAHIFDSS